jgi:DNA modification methylase
VAADLVWVKDRFVLGRQDYHYRHELIVEGEVPDDLEQPGAPRFDPEMILAGWKPGAGHRRPPDRRQDTVWEFARPARSSEHPTMKPVALVDRAIRNSTAPGEIVLDVFAGSGTTLIAAHRAGRVACLVEKDLGYADVICRRWQDHTGLLPRLEGGEPVDFTVPLAVVEDDA